MPKGPKVHPDIDKYIASLVSNNSHLQARQILAKLMDRFAGSDMPIPSLRTVQDRASRVRSRLTIQDEPWSLAAMRSYADEDIDIPWEATGYIMQAIAEMDSESRSKQRKTKDLWPYSYKTLISVKQDFENHQEDTEKHPITIRQAKWLWRLHQILPGLNILDLIPLADAYAQRELYSDYLGLEFDSSDLDNGLLLILKDIRRHGYYPARGDKDEGSY